MSCMHLDQIKAVTPSAQGCTGCLESGDTWVHVRLCMTCGLVGCCDSSPAKHASSHVREVGHPIVHSFEPGDEWFWCYECEEGFELENVTSVSYAT